MSECAKCQDSGWVCESHPDKAWGGMVGSVEGSCECGPGMLCECNQDNSKEWDRPSWIPARETGARS